MEVKSVTSVSKVLLQYYSVLPSTTPYHKVLLVLVLLCANYKVPVQFFSVLQSTTPVLLCTTGYYSVLQSTTPVLLCATGCYSVLQSTTPVLLRTPSTTPVLLCTTKCYCTTKYKSSTTPYYFLLLCTTPYYSSTTLYYKVLLQYFSPLQSNTHDCSSLHMKRHLQCAEQQKPSSNITKYCTCHAKWLS